MFKGNPNPIVGLCRVIGPGKALWSLNGHRPSSSCYLALITVSHFFELKATFNA